MEADVTVVNDGCALLSRCRPARQGDRLIRTPWYDDDYRSAGSACAYLERVFRIRIRPPRANAVQRSAAGRGIILSRSSCSSTLPPDPQALEVLLRLRE